MQLRAMERRWCGTAAAVTLWSANVWVWDHRWRWASAAASWTAELCCRSVIVGTIGNCRSRNSIGAGEVVIKSAVERADIDLNGYCLCGGDCDVDLVAASHFQSNCRLQKPKGAAQTCSISFVRWFGLLQLRHLQGVLVYRKLQVWFM